MDRAVLGIVAVLGIYDGIRLFGVPLFVPEPLGPGFYMLIISSLLLLALAIEATMQFICARRGELTRTKQKTNWSAVYRSPILQAWLGLVFYTISLELIGYFLATFLFTAVSIWIFGERRLARVAIGGGTMALCLYLLFKKLAGIPLP